MNTIKDEGLPEDFDPQIYLALNPDVKIMPMEPADHYILHGRDEGRAYRPPQGHFMPLLLTDIYDQDGLRSQHNHDFMVDADFKRAYARGIKAAGRDYNWHWRVHIGLWAARSAARLAGDFVECGVNTGFMSSAIMADLDWNETGRTFYLLDTFMGIDERYITDEEKAAGIMVRNETKIMAGTYSCDLEGVRNNFSEWPDATIIVGAIPDTLPEITSTQIAFLHLDLNCSPPEVATAEFLWERLVPGAFILLDDYAYSGYFTQKIGMDEFAKKQGVSIASLPTGQGLLIKPCG